MSAYTDIKYTPALSEVVYRPLEVAVGEGSHLCFMYLIKIKIKIEQCHKLLLVLGGDLAHTHSYSRRWQIARIGLCGRGAVCNAFAESIKMLNCPLLATFDSINASVLLLYTAGKIKNRILAWSSSDKLD